MIINLTFFPQDFRAALDPKTVDEISSVFKNLAKDITIIAVTHDMNFAKNIATRFVFMENGEITEDGSYQEVFEEKKHEKIRSFLQI